MVEGGETRSLGWRQRYRQRRDGRRRGDGSRSRAGSVISWAEVPGGRRQTMVGDGQMIRKLGSEVEMESRQTATGTGGLVSRSGQKALAYSGRQVGRGQAGSATGNRSGNCWKDLRTYAKLLSTSECVERRSLNRKGNLRGNRWK